MATSILQQYRKLKEKHPDAILLFRVGDFYECFSDDAIIASKILEITLTCRPGKPGEKNYLAGFPHHALDTYLPKLVRAGKRVAICKQLEDPKKNHPKVKKMLDKTEQSKNSYIDITLLISILTAFSDISNKIYIFDKICEKTKELWQIAATIGISPKKAFEECSKIINKTPTLF